MKGISSDVIKLLMDRFGEEEQTRQAMGECGEFIAAAQNYHRAKKFGDREESLKDLMSEVVDVYLMMVQMRHLDTDLFDEICENKQALITQKAKGLL